MHCFGRFLGTRCDLNFILYLISEYKFIPKGMRAFGALFVVCLRPSRYLACDQLDLIDSFGIGLPFQGGEIGIFSGARLSDSVELAKKAG